MSDKFAELDAVLDSESWSWLNENAPPLADAVQVAVQKGLMPTEIKRRVMERLGAHREALAMRCEAASRHLHAQEQRS